MAGFNHLRSYSRISHTGVGIGEENLPSGSCNYRDLTIGARAPTCGCKRFWLNSNHYIGQDGDLERVWCFCGHHACFHGFDTQQGQSSKQPSIAADRPPAIESGQVQDDFRAPAVSSQPKPAGLGIQSGSSTETPSINTRLWIALNEFARNQEDGPVSDTTSKLPSTACPSVAGEARLSPRRMLRERQSMGPPINIPSAQSNATVVEEYSATEVATPSMQGTPDMRAFAGPSAQVHASPIRQELVQAAASSAAHIPIPQQGVDDAEHCAPATRSSQQPPPETTTSRLSTVEVRAVLQTLGRRLEVLESLSFSQIPIEEIQEKFDLFEGRLLDLEHWRIESEQAHASPAPGQASSSKRSRILPIESSFSGSDGSFDSAAAAYTDVAVLATLAASAESGPRIDALETRVANLENASMPSYGRPWQVQVVLLPWGRDMRGIWFSALEATQHSLQSSTQASEEWTAAQSIPTVAFKAPGSGAWTTESIQAWADGTQEWLSPKACGPGGVVFQRLESRGLVQDVTITSPDSRHILSTICDAFGPDIAATEEVPADRTGCYQALREAVIPLRKVRKSSRLRFLSPAEMVSSAMWTAESLDASVIMKLGDGHRRLYVTTPMAYVQAKGDGWSWQQLRRLPIYNASHQEQAAQRRNVAIEACWTYNDRLDQPISAQPSFAAHDYFDSTDCPEASQEPSESEQQSRYSTAAGRPIHNRAVSLPNANIVTGESAMGVPKRRVASFETVGRTSMNEIGIGEAAASKRRRISTSPEAERRGVGLTPRCSREPPSPYTSEPAGEARSQGISGRMRATTPFAYATPHSNNYSGRPDFLAGDGDTEADTDIAMLQSEQGEDEWHGVEDGTVPSDPRSHCGSLEEAELDDENPEAGLTICES